LEVIIMNIFEKHGIRTITHARGYTTLTGGTVIFPEVWEAMTEASKYFVRMEELHLGAGKVVAEITGAEAGLVTNGAAAALMLAAAACIAGLDADKMDRLPDTTGMKDEIITQRIYRTDYDHACRAAGAKFVEIGWVNGTHLQEFEEAISDRTAAIFFNNHGQGRHNVAALLKKVAKIANKYSVPVIVDSAGALPPKSNLTELISQGADLVALSGGKGIRGPQPSGFLFGRRDLIMSALVQMMDADTYPETWPLRFLFEEGLTRPARQPIGRGLKVGKEEVIGAITALKIYAAHDPQEEVDECMQKAKYVYDNLKGLSHMKVELAFPRPNQTMLPSVIYTFDPKANFTAYDFILALHEHEPVVIVHENLAIDGKMEMRFESVRPGEEKIIVDRVRAVHKQLTRKS
jgi:L-seryl-tRNA(Ser) seleniumtransferase